MSLLEASRLVPEVASSIIKTPIWEVSRSTPSYNATNVAQFFWNHISSDLEMLMNCKGLNLDDSILAVHLVLKSTIDKHVSNKRAKHDLPVPFNNRLETREDRHAFEKEFCQKVICQVLKELPRKLEEANLMITKESTAADGQYLSKIFNESSDCPQNLQRAMQRMESSANRPQQDTVDVSWSEEIMALWRYHEPVSVCNLKLHMQQEAEFQSRRFPALVSYLKNYETLSAVRKYLKDILSLHTFLQKKLGYKIGFAEANSKTISDFLLS
eukprot:Platyproteum_vivax@DN12982_c0_g1_i1.p1